MKVLPDDYDENKSYPMMLVFHGAFSDYYDIREGSQFDKYANDYIIIYPQAKVENWEEGCKCNKPYRLGIDDVGFISKLIDEVSVEHKVQDKNIFAVGFSQGALFAQNIGCKLSDKINAIAAVAGSISEPLHNECEPENKVSVIAIHGENDNVLPYLGTSSGLSALMSAEETMQMWSRINSGSTFSRKVDKSNYVKFIYNEDKDTESVLYKIKGGNHVWPKSKLNASKVIYEFFNSKLKG